MRYTTSIRALVLSDLTVINVTTLALAFVVAEMLYKFRSFTLEAAAFLVTWYVLRLAARAIFRSV
ncbi:MAG: hypothetical protein FJ028_09420 [Chloroflexi bacterium]|nr:hypothetical protein [Chloroflexota bacterium]